MADPLHTRICLSCSTHAGPVVSLFLVPEPRVRGASMLHLLEQAPVTGAPRRDPELVTAVEAPRLPDVRVHAVAFAAADPDRRGVRAVFHDHYIADGPLGLDTGDPAEMARLALLPERSIGPRRIDDFQEYSVRRAMLAVYRYFGVDQRIPLMYHGFADPGGGWLALRTAAA
ncbi:hypothetical protein NDR87_17260 [Nocardia sp. CDC159]|uniref:Uncharacterized protein n=1 Tax=Nocardia pulmonis TaxID=2951408 RepID=A0A9X2IZD5_9NOCA|nr:MULTISPECIES: hypothetical protein [Nocardia]MCM6775915.1 hypothetical protein [Nocardia pulmonis]MCM6788109.1 hypothetical protein [Nocardia sp. CDC159]